MADDSFRTETEQEAMKGTVPLNPMTAPETKVEHIYGEGETVERELLFEQEKAKEYGKGTLQENVDAAKKAEESLSNKTEIVPVQAEEGSLPMMMLNQIEGGSLQSPTSLRGVTEKIYLEEHSKIEQDSNAEMLANIDRLTKTDEERTNEVDPTKIMKESAQNIDNAIVKLDEDYKKEFLAKVENKNVFDQHIENKDKYKNLGELAALTTVKPSSDIVTNVLRIVQSGMVASTDLLETMKINPKEIQGMRNTEQAVSKFIESMAIEKESDKNVASAMLRGGAAWGITAYLTGGTAAITQASLQSAMPAMSSMMAKDIGTKVVHPAITTFLSLGKDANIADMFIVPNQAGTTAEMFGWLTTKKSDYEAWAAFKGMLSSEVLSSAAMIPIQKAFQAGREYFKLKKMGREVFEYKFMEEQKIQETQIPRIEKEKIVPIKNAPKMIEDDTVSKMGSLADSVNKTVFTRSGKTITHEQLLNESEKNLKNLHASGRTNDDIVSEYVAKVKNGGTLTPEEGGVLLNIHSDEILKYNAAEKEAARVDIPEIKRKLKKKEITKAEANEMISDIFVELDSRRAKIMPIEVTNTEVSYDASKFLNAKQARNETVKTAKTIGEAGYAYTGMNKWDLANLTSRVELAESMLANKKAKEIPDVFNKLAKAGAGTYVIVRDTIFGNLLGKVKTAIISGIPITAPYKVLQGLVKDEISGKVFMDGYSASRTTDAAMDSMGAWWSVFKKEFKEGMSGYKDVEDMYAMEGTWERPWETYSKQVGINKEAYVNSPYLMDKGMLMFANLLDGVQTYNKGVKSVYRAADASQKDIHRSIYYAQKAQEEFLAGLHPSYEEAFKKAQTKFASEAQKVAEVETFTNSLTGLLDNLSKVSKYPVVQLLAPIVGFQSKMFVYNLKNTASLFEAPTETFLRRNRYIGKAGEEELLVMQANAGAFGVLLTSMIATKIMAGDNITGFERASVSDKITEGNMGIKPYQFFGYSYAGGGPMATVMTAVSDLVETYVNIDEDSKKTFHNEYIVPLYVTAAKSFTVPYLNDIGTKYSDIQEFFMGGSTGVRVEKIMTDLGANTVVGTSLLAEAKEIIDPVKRMELPENMSDEARAAFFSFARMFEITSAKIKHNFPGLSQGKRAEKDTFGFTSTEGITGSWFKNEFNVKSESDKSLLKELRNFRVSMTTDDAGEKDILLLSAPSYVSIKEPINGRELRFNLLAEDKETYQDLWAGNDWNKYGGPKVISKKEMLKQIMGIEKGPNSWMNRYYTGSPERKKYIIGTVLNAYQQAASSLMAAHLGKTDRAYVDWTKKAWLGRLDKVLLPSEKPRVMEQVNREFSTMQNKITTATIGQ